MEFIDFLTVILCSLAFFVWDQMWHKFFSSAPPLLLSQKKKWLVWIGQLGASFIFVFFLAFFENYLQVVHFWDGVIAGSIMALGTLIPMQFFLFLRGNIKGKIFLQESLASLINMMVIGGILAG